jgi:hypothetical protein
MTGGIRRPTWRSPRSSCGSWQPGCVVLKRRTRYGLRGMWGQAADQIAGIALRRARQLGLNQSATWQAVIELIDALAVARPLVRMRRGHVRVPGQRERPLLRLKEAAVCTSKSANSRKISAIAPPVHCCPTNHVKRVARVFWPGSTSRSLVLRRSSHRAAACRSIFKLVAIGARPGASRPQRRRLPAAARRTARGESAR